MRYILLIYQNTEAWNPLSFVGWGRAGTPLARDRSTQRAPPVIGPDRCR